MNSRETILLAALELASEKGLGAVTLSQIANKVGIQKPSLYSHFTSKEDLIRQLYKFLRETAKKESGAEMVDYGKLVAGKEAPQILSQAVESYSRINANPNMRMFYRFIMSERVLNKEAANIIVLETDKMILATKQLFYAMQIHKVMEFQNIDMAAVAFAMAIRSLLEYEIDTEFADQGGREVKKLIDDYIHYFCEIHTR